MMTSSRIALPIIAAIVTVGEALLAGSDDPVAMAVAGLTAWLLVPGLWSAAWLVHGDWRQLGVLALATVFLTGLASDWMVAGLLGSLTLGGLTAAWALTRRWRVLPLLAVTMLVLVPSVALPLAGASFAESVAEQMTVAREWYESQMPAEVSERDRTTALKEFDKASVNYVALVDRFWPSLLMSWLAGQTVLLLGIGWGLARLVDRNVPRPVVTPLSRWRAPFASVWVLIGGLALSLMGGGTAAKVGWNLVAVSGTLLVFQGLGVQIWLVRRVLPPLAQTIYWVLGALFFALVLIGVGGLFGLADQWLDLRRLRQPPGSGDSDAP